MMQRKIDAREVGLRGRVHFIRLSARSVLRLACVYAWGKGAPASVAVSRPSVARVAVRCARPGLLIQAERTGGKIQETNRPVQYRILTVTTAAPALSVLVP